MIRKIKDDIFLEKVKKMLSDFKEELNDYKIKTSEFKEDVNLK